MAKKKKVEEEIDEFEDEEIESVYPEIKPKSGKVETESKSIAESNSNQMEESLIEDMETIPEEVIQVPEYKFLDLSINKGKGNTDFVLRIDGQTHGFCNIFVKHLLNIDSVNIAAYKFTGLEPAEVFIRLENGFKIKKVLLEGINLLREEIETVQKIFKKLM